MQDWETKAEAVAAEINRLKSPAWEASDFNSGGNIICVSVTFDVVEFVFGDAAETLRGDVSYEGEPLNDSGDLLDTKLVIENETAETLAKAIVASIEAYIAAKPPTPKTSTPEPDTYPTLEESRAAFKAAKESKPVSSSRSEAAKKAWDTIRARRAAKLATA